MKREKPATPPLAPMAPMAAFAAGVTADGGAAAAAGFVGAGPAEAAPAAASVPPMMAAAALPRAGFWIRMAALLLDLILVGILLRILSATGGAIFIAIAAYGAVMWKLKGTTIGGIVCGLKVVRLDGREIDWSVAIVRALGCFLSAAVVGLGFIWVAFDDERQSWHDKIAGTTVVRVPKGVALV